MKVLLTGGSGLLGQYLNVTLSGDKEFLSLYFENTGNCHKFDSIRFDIRDKGKLSLLFGNFRPDVVIHTACYSRPEICAKLDRNEVYHLNVDATENIARLCNDFNSKLIYTSTDLVYDGSGKGLLKEDADLNPLTLYAESKLMGEIAIQRNCNNYVILRTSLLIGFGLCHSRNNFHNTFELLKSGRQVSLFSDQFRSPLALHKAAGFIGRLCEMSVSNEIINFGGKDRVSRLEIGEMICESGGFNKDLIKSTSCKTVEGIIQVPDVSMNIDKLAGYGLKQDDISDTIDLIIRNA
ncbi:MAG: sugar nucleotide-binding protein [Ignavibacteria bacterium]|nr:sugar nucleotide-binding protein [Ignavibacteria bacterium]